MSDKRSQLQHVFSFNHVIKQHQIITFPIKNHFIPQEILNLSQVIYLQINIGERFKFILHVSEAFILHNLNSSSRLEVPILKMITPYLGKTNTWSRPPDRLK